MELFCPFIKGNCKQECVFYNNTHNDGDPYTCMLYDAADMIRSFGFGETRLEDYLQSINDHADDISSNLSSVQTRTSSIDSELSSIRSRLDEVNDKLK